MLFSETMFGEEEIFADYYEGRTYFRLKRAYLAYVSREYVVNGRQVKGCIFAVSYTHLDVYKRQPYVVIDDNEPDFTEDELTDQSYESYSDLDELGRCGVAASNIGTDLMPTGKRGKIGQVKPSGWQTIKFDNVDGKYLYNRCHLIGYQLTAENANEKNLITGTRYMNCLLYTSRCV